MRNLLVGLVAATALVGVVGTAMAADMPFKAPAYVAPPVSWTGFYFGGNVGGYGADQTVTTDAFPSPGFGAPAILGAGVPGFGNLPTSHGLNSSGVLGGIQTGYNWQASNWLFGIEGDVDFLNRNASNNQTVLETFTAAPAPAFNMLVSANNHYLASLRGRLGWVAGPWLLYATGGAAWTNTSYTATATGLVAGAVFLPGIGATTSFSDTNTGWVAGGGVEWMLTPNWLLRAEYLHYDFSGASGTLPLVFTAPFGACPAGACNWAVHSSDLQFNTGRVGLSYKF
jgi:outer membrane immunogenic protein